MAGHFGTHCKENCKGKERKKKGRQKRARSRKIEKTGGGGGGVEITANSVFGDTRERERREERREDRSRTHTRRKTPIDRLIDQRDQGERENQRGC
jgi:hypothetical protein